MRRAMLSVGLLVMALATAHPARGATLELSGAPSERAARAALEPALRAPQDSLALSAALGTLVAQLEEQGYWSARATGSWQGDARLAVRVSLGPRLRLASVSVRATPAADSARIAEALTLRPGEWAGPQAVGVAIENATAALGRAGYAYAELGVGGMSADSAGAHLIVDGVLGPKVTIESVRIEGLHVTRPDVAQRAMGRLAGLPYRPAAADAARERLLQLGLFRSVDYQGLEGRGDWSRGTLVYRAQENSYNRFEGAVGSQGSAGTAGAAHLELGNLLGTGRAVGLDWQSQGHGSNDFGARYAEPLVGGLPLRLEGALSQEVRDSTYTRTRWGATGRWTLTAEDGVSLGFEEEQVVQPHADVVEARLENTSFGLERVTLDDPFAPARGTRVSFEATQSFKRETLRPEGETTARASAAEMHGEYIRPLSRTSGLSLGLEGAGRFSSEPVLPVFERYPLGGAASLRGYDEEAFRVDRYLLSHLEWRVYIGTPRQRFITFWDHAWTATRVRDAAGTLLWDTFQKDGVGFGLRVDTAAGLVSVDYGLAAGRPPIEGKIHLRLISTF